MERRVLPRLLTCLALTALALLPVAASETPMALPNLPDSVKFAVIGDNGTGERPQYEVGERMAQARGSFQFDLVIMLGDNMYGRQKAKDYIDKFERPYGALLTDGVSFRASLGNHDDPEQRFYKNFGMSGQRFYTFAWKYVRFVVLDTNVLDKPQVEWFDKTLGEATEPWKICYFHHPIYSNAGRHGSDVEMRVILEPILTKYGVNAVFSGHDHAYERIRPQKGITYFVEGSSGKLREGDVGPSPNTAASFDQDRTFMLVEISDERMVFQTISRTGEIIDSGVVLRRPQT